jgi:hypothetical protein
VKGAVLIATGALGLAAAAMLGPVALAGDEPRVKLRGAVFVESCRFSHRSPDDPIVFPGRPGLSHDHTFVGNRTTNAFSTYGSLRAGRTSCRRSADTAAYWLPTLYQGFSLASGGQLGGHADFVNTWRPSALERLVQRCLNELACGQR